ncbi:RSP_7527 family protein [Rhodobaculum claviforme]|uniref:Uncharacterized protein n=1 Tax=Rhodobaculum claviforme TaxID=1549854 RepID=A0A934TLG6_9RHOB|nr:hypothetical protein [Rhodobaculum claviforme]MBK5928324.1 hypothetical protein [Rhodobaculum claviforme]
MDRRTATDEISFELPENLDMVAIERRARELRAEAFGDMMRALGQMVARRAAAFRGAGQSRTA